MEETQTNEESTQSPAELLAAKLPGCADAPPGYLLHPDRNVLTKGPKLPRRAKPHSEETDFLFQSIVSTVDVMDKAKRLENLGSELEKRMSDATAGQLLTQVLQLLLWDPDPMTDRYLRGFNLDNLVWLASMIDELATIKPYNQWDDLRFLCMEILRIYRGLPAGTPVSSLDCYLSLLITTAKHKFAHLQLKRNKKSLEEEKKKKKKIRIAVNVEGGGSRASSPEIVFK